MFVETIFGLSVSWNLFVVVAFLQVENTRGFLLQFTFQVFVDSSKQIIHIKNDRFHQRKKKLSFTSMSTYNNANNIMKYSQTFKYLTANIATKRP